MKKLFCFLALIATFGLINIPSYAAESPSYDSTYNNNQGAFFANGTPIIISEVDGNTIITWDGGSHIVPNTVSVFGGGNGGNYDSSQITMESGTVQNLVAGGLGYTADKSSTVTTANVIINGGTISNAVAGGGYFNAKVNESNIQMNGGTALTVQGGGMASGKIDGVNYSVGTKEDSISSPNRTETANVTDDVNTANSTDASVQAQSDELEVPLVLNQTYTRSFSQVGQKYYFTFTPEETGYYYVDLNFPENMNIHVLDDYSSDALYFAEKLNNTESYTFCLELQDSVDGQVQGTGTITFRKAPDIKNVTLQKANARDVFYNADFETISPDGAKLTVEYENGTKTYSFDWDNGTAFSLQMIINMHLMLCFWMQMGMIYQML